MKNGCFFLLVGFILLYPQSSFAQELISWGRTFDCAVEWFKPCLPRYGSIKPEEDKDKKPEAEKSAAISLVTGPNDANLPAPVKNVLENPSPETAREYVAWRRKANEALALASDYIVRAEQELGSPQGSLGDRIKKKEEIEKRGLVGLYYFFSPTDRSAREDVRVLNRVWREERLGVVGIPVKGRDEDVVRFVKITNPLFPVRKGEDEIQLIRPKGTPVLYLALPVQKKIFTVGSGISEEAIKETLGKVVAELYREQSGLSLK